MSAVRGSTSVVRIRQGSTLSGKIISTKSLIQYVTEGVGIAPDWTVAANQPILYLSVLSSLSTAMITHFSNVKWFFDDAEILDTDTRFEKGTYTVGSSQIPSLKIKANIMQAATSNKSIKATYEVTAGGVKTDMSSTIDVQRQVASATTYVGEIGATNGGVVTTDVPSITLNSALMKGGQSVTDYTIEWWKVVANDTDGTLDGMMDTGKTSKTITLTKNDIGLMETYVAKFFVGGTLVTQITFDVRDETDPYDIKFEHSNYMYVNPAVSDVITATVVTVGTDTVVPAFNHFAFSLRNGTELLHSQARSTSNQFSVAYSYLENSGMDKLIVDVEADDLA